MGDGGRARPSPALWTDANRAFFASGVWRTVFDSAGRRIIKYPTDLWVFHEIIEQVRPKVVVETGSAEGGSASWFADQGVEVISIDLVSPARDERVTWITGDSTDAGVVEETYTLVGGKSCLVTLDSDHGAPHVAAEIAAYAGLVSRGSYLVVEDTAVDAYGLDLELYPDGGPLVAVEDFLATDHRFSPDRECDRFMLGMNPGGWLRRR